MTEHGIGAPVRRKEDRRFLTGRGRFVTDIELPGMVHGRLLRSPHAHARIESIDVSAAASLPGVIAVLTGADMAGNVRAPMPAMWQITSPDGQPMAEPARWPLARGAVRHVGEPVAIAIAESAEQALDAIEAIVVDYAELPAETSASRAIRDGAPQIHDDAPGNVCFLWARGDAEAVDAAMSKADHIVRISLTNQRIAGAAMEPRAAIGVYDDMADTYTLYDSTQIPHLVRRSVTTGLGIPEGKLRVVSPDVGGGFGYKGKHYPEETIVVWAARHVGRPVKWVANRAESFLSDTQARDHATEAELGLDAEGNFLGIRVRTVANIGAYISTMGAAIPSAIYSALLAGVYKTPAVCVEVTGVFTNTVPVDAYRGAGRPEAAFVLERLADTAAETLGIDRAEIRSRNLIPSDAMPYTTPIGPTYDCGDFPRMMSRAIDTADVPGFADRRAASESRGRLRGLGISNFVESSGVAPSRLAGMMGARAGFFEAAEVRVDASAGVQVMLGTHNHGQGHATTFAQIVSDKLGVPFENVEIVEGDTAAVPLGTGTFGSRSTAVGGSALVHATDKIVDKGKRIAAHMLEAAATDIEFADGNFTVAGTDRRVGIADVARTAYVPHDYPLEELEPGLVDNAYYDPPNFAFSNGSHVCEVEIDPETGVVTIDAYNVVDDIGTVINPLVVEGQTHGALAQGIGQAMTEAMVYDGESGQPLSGSFMDYTMPRADDLISFVSELDESQPCTHNPLGVKGCGESGTIGAPPAIVGAVLDALAPLGVTDIEMPVTPFRVWKAIQKAAA